MATRVLRGVRCGRRVQLRTALFVEVDGVAAIRLVEGGDGVLGDLVGREGLLLLLRGVQGTLVDRVVIMAMRVLRLR